jgi:WD40 repeat protein
VKFSADGRKLVSGSHDGTIRIWDPETGKLGLVLESLFASVKCLACSYDGRWIVSGHVCRGLQLWDAVSGESGPVLHGHASTVTGVAFSSDDKWIVSSSYDDTIRLWDSSAGVCVSILTGHKKVVRDVAFSPDGIHLASGGDDGRVRLWDISSIGWSVDDLQEHHVGHFGKAMYSSKDLFLLSDSDRSVRRWDPLAGKPGSFVFTFPRGAEMAYMKVSPDGNQIAVRAVSGLVQLWDRQAGTVGCVLEGHKSAVFYILYSPCGRWLLSRDQDDNNLLWDLHDMKQGSHVRAEVDEKGLSNAFHAAFPSSGNQIAILYNDKIVRIFDLPSRNLKTTMNWKRYDPYTLAYSHNGQQLAIGCKDGSLYLWNNPSDDEEFSAKLSGHQNRIFSVAYSTCGQWIASGSRDETVRLWHRLPEEAESWSNVATVSSPFESVFEVAWSPVIPMQFVAHYSGKTFRVWRVSSDGRKAVVRMQWGSNLRILNAEGLVFKSPVGLSPINRKLLVQRGAVDGSLIHEEDERKP